MKKEPDEKQAVNETLDISPEKPNSDKGAMSNGKRKKSVDEIKVDKKRSSLNFSVTPIKKDKKPRKSGVSTSKWNVT